MFNSGTYYRALGRSVLCIQDALQAYYTKWLGGEKTTWFLSLRFNKHTKYAAEDCMSDELKTLVRQIFARDYALYYP